MEPATPTGSVQAPSRAPRDSQRVARGLSAGPAMSIMPAAGGARKPPARYTRTSGSSSAYLPFASAVPSSGYEPLKQASQCLSDEPRTAS